MNQDLINELKTKFTTVRLEELCVIADDVIQLLKNNNLKIDESLIVLNYADILVELCLDS